MFTVIPAVDLKGGRCVRLRQGRASEETVYSNDPVRVAQQWETQGAEWLHIVDVDGALAGHPVHAALIAQILRVVSIPVQVGGGIRADADIERLLDAGAARVILGTRACRNADDLAQLIDRFRDRVAVGIDARQGRVQIQGWTETTPVDAATLAARVDQLGVQTLIYTDTVLDGMLKGPNLPGIQAVCERVACRVIASGGVSSAEDIAALGRLHRPNLAGAIVGKALYEGAVTLQALRDACPKRG